jgi:hypothetical protein
LAYLLSRREENLTNCCTRKNYLLRSWFSGEQGVSVEDGDEAEVGFYLKLAEPICTFGDNDSVDTYPQAGITAIQLVIDQDRYDQLEPLIGMQISIVGKLYASHTGHHHAPLLITDVSLVQRDER